MELTRNMKGKEIFTVEEVADILKEDTESVKDYIESGDLPAIGSMKSRVKRIDLYRFINGDMLAIENIERPIDAFGNQRYSNSHSIEVKDLSDEEWDEVVKKGERELNPYFDKLRKKWCLALSLGYDENHKRIRKVIQANTKPELWAKYGQFQCENKVLPAGETVAAIPPVVIEKPKHPKSDMLFKDYVIKYLKGIENIKHPRTYETKVNSARHIIEGLGNYKMCQINKDILREFINQIPKKTYEKGSKKSLLSQSSINKIYDLLRTIIKEASDEEEILEKNFMQNIDKPDTKVFKETECKAFSCDEIKRISEIVKANKMIDTWVHSMLYTGMRPSEALALKFSDINYEECTIKIVRALSKEAEFDLNTQKRASRYKAKIKELKNAKHQTKVNYQERTLKVSINLLEIIKSWESYVKGNTKLMEMKRANNTEEFLFCGSKGQLWTYDDYLQVYDRLLEKSGLKVSNFTPYKFRHTYCTESLRNGTDLKTVQLMLGDNTPDMVLRVYANMNKDDILRGSKIFSENMDRILLNVG